MQSLEWLAIHKTGGRGLDEKKAESQKLKRGNHDNDRVHLLSVCYMPVSRVRTLHHCLR